MRIKFIQKIIDKFRKVTDNYLFYMVFDKLYHIKNRKPETLILASSHMAWGYSSNDEKIYNMAFANQDLYYTYNLYKLLSTSETKNIIFDFSVFSPCYNLIKTNDAENCALFKVLFDINYINKDIAQQKKLFLKEKVYLKNKKYYSKKIEYKENYNGCIHREAFPTDFIAQNSAQERALGHYKNLGRNETMINYLEQLIADTKSNNQNLYAVITPCMEEYRKNIPDEKVLYKWLYDNFENKNIINFYSDKDFSKKDFYDWDHLNYSGAIKLTSKINSYIRRQLKNEN